MTTRTGHQVHFKPAWLNDFPAIERAYRSAHAYTRHHAGAVAAMQDALDRPRRGFRNTSNPVTAAAVTVAKLNNGNATAGTIAAQSSDPFKEGITLIAGSVSGDIDGDATDPAATYKLFKDGDEIPGATSATYKTSSTGTGDYKVAITYKDAQGFVATVESQTQAVGKIDNGQGSASAITSSTPGLFQEGVTLTAGSVSGDIDGDAAAPQATYQWYKNGAVITGATGATYQVSDTGTGDYKVAITYKDAQDFVATVESQAQAVVKFNNGKASFAINGSAAVGVTLNATPTADSDGDGPFTYAWETLSGATWGTVGTNNSSYTVLAADEGKQLRLRVNYTDAQDYVEEVITLAGIVPAFNNGPAVVVINGTPAVGTNITTTITPDPDGDGIRTYYWETKTGSTWSRVGADSSSYTVSASDEGKELRLRIVYNDAQGFAEEVTTSAGLVPFVNDGPAGVIINGTPAVGVLLTTTVTADPDGSGILVYSWQTQSGSTWSEVGSASSYTVAVADEGKPLRLRVSYNDLQGFPETVIVDAGTVPFVNDGKASFTVTGASTPGAPAVNNVLTATPGTPDPDGNGAFSYAWQSSSDNGGTWTVITGATSNQYTVISADQGKAIRVQINYTDAQGFAEEVIAPAGTVAFSAPVATTGNDNLVATPAGGAITGVPATDGTLGRGTRDKLAGNSGIDTFVLGDSRGFFYNDGVTTNAGTSDFCFIVNFTVGSDKIQLAGASTQYFLNAATITDPVTGTATAGVGIYRNDGTGNGSKSSAWDGKDELVGFVAAQTATTLGSLSGSSFVYVAINTGPVVGGTAVSGSNGSDGTSASPVTGTANNETFSLIGAATNLGQGQLDYAKGNGGNDLFVLGDSRGVFYKDSSTTAPGTSDLLWVTDFNSGDAVQLRGAASDYRLVANYNLSGSTGTGIFLNDGSGSGSSKSAWDSKDELIGFLQVASGLSLTNSGQFIYV